MKKDRKFDQWIDRSIAKLMRLTDEIDKTNSRESKSKQYEAPIFQLLPPHAEASDFLSINEWLQPPEAPGETYRQE